MARDLNVETVADVGEFGVIARLKRAFDRVDPGIARGIGDDTAALRVTPGWLLLATTDAAVEGVHFRRATTTPENLGRRALAVNLSDIASMGGVPRWALVSMGMPPDTPIEFVDGVAAGLAAEAARYGTTIVGGNLARSPDRLLIDVTLLGEVEPNRVVYRHGARAGDRILVTGTLGDSAAGLAILQGRASADGPDAHVLIDRHRLPTPRVEAGRRIGESGRATAMIDLSDGLASDLGHLAEESKIGAVVEVGRLPLSPALRQAARNAGVDPVDWAVRGGEDYELLLTAPPDQVSRLVNAVGAVGVRLTEIGEITTGSDLWLRWPDGRRAPVGQVAWEHFG